LEPTKEELQKILESLSPGEWVNPQIFSWNDEYRVRHTLVATKPESGAMYYYDPDLERFEPLSR
jgi:hypothetical protein